MKLTRIVAVFLLFTPSLDGQGHLSKPSMMTTWRSGKNWSNKTKSPVLGKLSIVNFTPRGLMRGPRLLTIGNKKWRITQLNLMSSPSKNTEGQVL